MTAVTKPSPKDTGLVPTSGRRPGIGWGRRSSPNTTITAMTPVNGIKTTAMTNLLAGKIALVTGGAKRVGQAIALRLAHEGMDIALTFHTSAAEARKTAQQIQQMGRHAHTIQADLTQPDAADDIHDQFTQRFGRLDALVNNAACFAPTPIGTITPDDFTRYMAVNAGVPLMLIQKFAPMLGAAFDRDRPATTGRVVNLTDAHITPSGPSHRGHTVYNASKAALLEITRSAAVELAPKVTVNALAPGVVAWSDTISPEQRQRYVERVPLARAGTVDDVAGTALFLIRDAHYCTGQVILLDGGRTLV